MLMIDISFQIHEPVGSILIPVPQPAIPALERLREEQCSNFKASFGHIVKYQVIQNCLARPCFNKTKTASQVLGLELCAMIFGSGPWHTRVLFV